MRRTAMTKFDISFQFRHGFYYAYLFVSLVYIVLLRMIPWDIKPLVATLLVFSDPGIMGFYFVGGIFLLERGQNVLDNLFVTPFQVEEYLLAKAVSLAFLAVSTSFAIVVFTFGTAFNPWPLFLGVAFTSGISTLAGLTLAVKAASLNGYLFTSPLFLVPFSFPLIDYLGVMPSRLFYLLPGKASLVLIEAAFLEGHLPEMLFSVGSLAAWTGATFFWARGSFYQAIILKAGGKGK
jgi:fluoroquinolone transport system permease protein